MVFLSSQIFFHHKTLVQSIFFISGLFTAYPHPPSILYVNRLLFLNTTWTVSFLCTKLSMSTSFATLWTVAHQVPLAMGFSRQYWSGLPFPAPGELPHPGIKPASLVSPESAGGFFTAEPLGKSEAGVTSWQRDPEISSPERHESESAAFAGASEGEGLRLSRPLLPCSRPSQD